MNASFLSANQDLSKSRIDIDDKSDNGSTTTQEKAKLLVLKDKSSKQMWVQRAPKRTSEVMAPQKVLNHSQTKVRARVKAKLRQQNIEADSNDSKNQSVEVLDMIETPNNNQREGS